MTTTMSPSTTDRPRGGRRLARTLSARVRAVVTAEREEAGQTTAEYALVILGAAAVATLLITWAKGSDAISSLFDEVVSKIL